MAGRGKGRVQPRRAGESCPLTFLLRCMDDEGLEWKERIDCAKAIMPYRFRKMPTEVEAKGLENVAAIHVHFE